MEFGAKKDRAALLVEKREAKKQRSRGERKEEEEAIRLSLYLRALLSVWLVLGAPEARKVNIVVVYKVAALCEL